MKLLQDYCEDPSKRYLLNNFSKKVFNLDFSKWEGNGFWDSAYKPISLLDNGEIISNVSIYSLEMIINGKKCKVAQLSTVGTLPEYRKKGFGNKLINEAIKILEKNHELIFLFADEDAVEFYQTLGFSFKMESKYVARIPKYQRKKGLQQLDMKNKTDLMKLHKYAQKRISVSDVIGIFNENLLMFHGLYTLTEHIYFIPDLDIIIIYKIKENKLVLFDIIGRYIPKPDDLFPYIIDENITEVEFHFVPDKLDLKSIQTIDFKENQLHIIGAFPFTSEKFIFPYTSHA